MLRKYYYIAVFLLCFMVSARAEAQLAIESLSNINFGTIIFTQSHSAMLRLGTNGSLTVTGSGIESTGIPTAGEISLASQEDSGTIELRCSASGSLNSSTGGSAIQMQNAEISVNAGRNFGSGDKCAGTNSVEPTLLYSLGSAVPARVLIGVELDLVNGQLSSSGEYSTGAGSGTPIAIDVIFQ